MVEYTSETDRVQYNFVMNIQREFLNTIEPLTPFLFFCIDQLRGNPTEVHSVEEWKHLWRELPEHKKRVSYSCICSLDVRRVSSTSSRCVQSALHVLSRVTCYRSGMDTPSAQYRRHRLNEAVPPHQPTCRACASPLHQWGCSLLLPFATLSRRLSQISVTAQRRTMDQVCLVEQEITSLAKAIGLRRTNERLISIVRQLLITCF